MQDLKPTNASKVNETDGQGKPAAPLGDVVRVVRKKVVSSALRPAIAAHCTGAINPYAS